jgi:segregation and condensation protein B
MNEHDDDAPDEGEGEKPEEAGDTEAPPADPSMGPGEVNLDDEDDDAPEGPGLHGSVALALDDLPGALEALILVSDKPIPAVRLARLTRQDIGMVRQKLAELQGAYAGRGLVLDEIAGGYQFRTSARYAPFVRNLVQQKPVKLTRAQLEVLAIIAYRQPVTRPEIEDVRGVDSGSALKVLLERSVIKIIGKRDDAGRPMLYGTSTEFLELFGLKSLKDLPTLKEFAELTPESRDIYERRIGEPVPQGSAMNLDTHYEAPPDRDIPDDASEAKGEGEAEGESEAENENEAEGEGDGDGDEPRNTLPDPEPRGASAIGPGSPDPAGPPRAVPDETV